MGRRQPRGAWAFLPVSREGGGQCDVPSPSVNGPMEKSSVQFTADSVTGLQGRADCASLLPLLSSEHVEFLLFQGRRKLAAGHRRAKCSSDAMRRTRGPDPSSKATLWVKAQHEGALPPPCIVRKGPRVPHTGRRGA